MAQFLGILSMILGLVASIVGGGAMTGAFAPAPTAMALGPAPAQNFDGGFTAPAGAALGNQPVAAAFVPPAPAQGPAGAIAPGTAGGPMNLGPVAVGPEGSGAPLWVKGGASIGGLRPEIRGILSLVVQVWQRHGGPTPVITSGNDGRHSNGSLHYSNLALDLRGNNIPGSTASAIRSDLQASLGGAYQVFYETFPGNPSNNHIHIEYDPA